MYAWSKVVKLLIFICITLTGVTVELPDTEESCLIRATVLCCTADLPAKALVQNHMPFNGFYGCSFCEQPGQTMVTKGGGHVHVYPFDPNSPSGPEKEHCMLMQYASQALEQQEPVCIIKYIMTCLHVHVYACKNRHAAAEIVVNELYSSHLMPI